MWTAIRPFWRLTQVALPNAVFAAQRHILEPFIAFFAPELCRTESCHRELVIHFVKTPTFCNEAGLAGVSGTASWQERHINHHGKGAPGLYEH